MDPYRTLFRHLLLPTWETTIRRRATLARWAELERTQWGSPEQIRAGQRAELRALLTHAQTNIPYYREIFADAGLDPRDVRDVRDLGCLPRLTKDVVRARYEDLVDARTRARHVHKRTSGSTGIPFRFEYDRDSEVWRHAARWRGYGFAGYRPGARALYYWGQAIPIRGWKGLKIGLDRAFRRERFVNCFEQDEASLLAAIDVLRTYRPEFMVGFTVATAILARFILDRKSSEIGPVTVLCAAEGARDGDREAIAQAFGGPVFDTYGSRETMLLATECEMHDGLHTMDETHVIETVIGERPARPGEVGDVLVTDLHNYGMPLIRYQNGDLAMAREDAPCACGRGLGRIERVMGRKSETLRNAQGDPIPGMLVHSMISHLQHSLREVQVVQRASGEVVLRVVPGGASDGRVLETMATTVRTYLRGLPVRVEAVETIERGPNGKHRCIMVEPPAIPSRDNVAPIELEATS
jgi:phenylacetate-CoA ligase